MNHLLPSYLKTGSLLFAMTASLLILSIDCLGIDSPGYRHPVAIIETKSGYLLTANSKSGTVSLINPETGVLSEHKVGQSPQHLIELKPNRFLTVDFATHELIEFSIINESIKILFRSAVEKYPQRVVVADNLNKVFVSSLWSRRLTVLERGGDDKSFQKVDRIDLDFAPREILFLPKDRRLLVAGQFQGKMAVINSDQNRVEWVHDTTAHNIRGLGITPDGNTVLVSHQMLNELAHTSRNDIHWGLLMSNDLRWIEKAALLKQSKELYKFSHMHPLGKENNAAGDPSGLSCSSSGTVVVTISGTNEIAFGQEDDFWLQRISVGRRPVAVAINSSGSKVFTANSFDDSISVVDLKQKKVTSTISLGPMRNLTGIEKGEQLFFDASLSHDGWMSCHSCHTDGHSNGGLNDNFTDGSFGAPKRVLSLLGRQDTEPLAWYGSTPDFKSQVRNSIVSTMKSKETPSEKSVEFLAQFLKTLPPPPSLSAARNEINRDLVNQGKKLFNKMGCVSCHAPPRYTSPERYDVGLKDETDHSQFNPPPLLGVSQRSSFFHDGRAKSLKEVLFKHRHQIPKDTKEDQLKLLLEFLNSL